MSDLGQKLAEKLEMEQEAEELKATAQKILAKKKIRKTVVSIILVLVLVVGSSLCSFLYASGMQKAKAEQKAAEEIADLKAQIQELEEMPVSTEQIRPEVNLINLKTQIVDIGELASVEYIFSNTSRFKDAETTKKGKTKWGTEKSFLVECDGVIKAGIKLEAIIMEVKEQEKKILIYLPEAEILSYEIDEDSVKVLEEESGIFTEITVEDKVKFDADVKESMKSRAIENGILEKAQKNAEAIIERIVTADAAIRDEYTVEFKY